jgi:hypothetical protein
MGTHAFIVLYTAQPEVPEYAVRVDGAGVVEQNGLFCGRHRGKIELRRRFRSLGVVLLLGT